MEFSVRKRFVAHKVSEWVINWTKCSTRLITNGDISLLNRGWGNLLVWWCCYCKFSLLCAKVIDLRQRGCVETGGQQTPALDADSTELLLLNLCCSIRRKSYIIELWQWSILCIISEYHDYWSIQIGLSFYWIGAKSRMSSSFWLVYNFFYRSLCVFVNPLCYNCWLIHSSQKQANTIEKPTLWICNHVVNV